MKASNKKFQRRANFQRLSRFKWCTESGASLFCLSADCPEARRVLCGDDSIWRTPGDRNHVTTNCMLIEFVYLLCMELGPMYCFTMSINVVELIFDVSSNLTVGA